MELLHQARNFDAIERELAEAMGVVVLDELSKGRRAGIALVSQSLSQHLQRLARSPDKAAFSYGRKRQLHQPATFGDITCHRQLHAPQSPHQKQKSKSQATKQKCHQQEPTPRA